MTTYPGRIASTGNTPTRVAAVAYTVLLAACVVASVGWLVIGAVVAVATYSPAVSDALGRLAAGGNGWARGVLAAVPGSEPLGQVLLDYGFAALNLAIAGALLFLGMRTWVTQLLAVAMIGSAGAFNLQAHAAAVAIKAATGLDVGAVHQVLLHGVSCAAYVVALLLLPAGRWELGRRSGPGRVALVAVAVGTLVVVGIGTTLLPHTVSCILFFGFTVPLVGLAVLPRRIRQGATAELRTQARLLFSVLLAAFGTCAVLAVLTLLLWYLDEPGLTMVDPGARHAAVGAEGEGGQPTALLFWFSRLTAAGIGASVLVAIRRGRLWAAERVFSRGLAAMMVIVLVGGAYVVAHAVAGWMPGSSTGAGAVVAAALATGLAAVAFLPVYLRAEQLVDRLLYGQRPTPYRVLADVAALSRTASTEGPDLAGLAEAIGRGLSARSCRLTVLRPGLRERTYAWSDGSPGDDDMVVLPIRQGTERIGAIAVDRGAVAGLHNERRTLLEDVADSLGAVLQASRLGIELERELRAAVAHAEDIAASRRQAVAEMDSERRMIERDLHDGAQHHLVSLRLALGLVEHEVRSDQYDQARDRLTQLADQLANTEAVLARTATGVSSIVLTERGLAAALTSTLAADAAGPEAAVAVEFADAVADARYGPDIESAVYFCCLESVNNARKHAPGAEIKVRLESADGTLRFTVRDEGPGFDPSTTTGSPGRGMRNVVARIIAVGGEITVDSAPGAGTTIHGHVPLPPAAPHPAQLATPPEPPPPLPPAETTHADRPATTTPGSAEPPIPAQPGPTGPPIPARPDPAEPPISAQPGSAERPIPAQPGSAEPLEPATPAPVTASPPQPPPAPTEPQPTTAGTPTPSAPDPPTSPSPRPAPPPPSVATPSADPTPSPPPVPATSATTPTAPDLATNGDRSLLGQARALVRAAIEIYPDAPERDRLDELAERLGQPLRVAVLGPAGAGGTTLARALHSLPDAPSLELLDGDDVQDPDAPPPHAVLLLLPEGSEGSDVSPACPDAPAIGLLTRADECGGSCPDALKLAAGQAEELGADPELARRCQTVIPVAALLATGGAALTPDEFDTIRTLSRCPAADLDDRIPPELLGRLGRFGARAAVELVREATASTPSRLAEELTRLSGVAQLRDMLTWRFARPADAATVRATLRSLDELIGASPREGRRAHELLYQLDRLRSGAHELVETDLADALRAGSLRLSEVDQRLAERLLGAGGVAPTARLGLAGGAAPDAIATAARDQLAYWQRLASHPASTTAIRDAAEVLARTCEELLASTSS
ncbi:ATP-binding protein [Pseudonocardia acaciae]|uniref:ATP-binding protein n=1 Tax=Pseudonocardia acaciae TaxID=551276 RepID=UPI000685F828|nr:ATP-binding protein [Pseudonocardia acaciae]